MGRTCWFFAIKAVDDFFGKNLVCAHAADFFQEASTFWAKVFSVCQLRLRRRFLKMLNWSRALR
jgi:hypothetical protein